MGQETEVVLPLVDARLANKVEEVSYPVLGSGYRLLFEETPQSGDLEIIAAGLSVAATKATGEMHTFIDDSIGSDIIFGIKDQSGNIRYRVFSSVSYRRPNDGSKKVYPAVAILQDPESTYDRKILNDYSREPKTRIKPKTEIITAK